MDYTQHVSTKATPQTQPILGKKQIENSAGGFVYEVDSWKRLRRFLILGSEGGTYYAKEAKLTQENAKNVIGCIQNDTKRAVSEIVAVSTGGLAPKNDPAIFALALACTYAAPKDRGIAYAAITSVCRMGTHLFTFCQAIQQLRGWSRGLRSAVAKYYQQDSKKLEYQLIKYRQRNGWTHRDVLRLCHAQSEANNGILRWTVGKAVEGPVGELIGAYETLSKKEKLDNEALDLITKLPWEAVPTQFLKEAKVWEALLPTMPLMALMRNLNKYSLYCGVTSNLSEHSKFIADQFNAENVKRSKLHPLKILEGAKIYGAGRGFKGDLTWKPAPRIQDALDAAFYHGFKNVEPTGKNFFIGLDVSGSMTSQMSGSFLSCAEVSAALAMTIARTESNYGFLAFTNKPQGINIRPTMTLAEVTKLVYQSDFGSTDCSLPIVIATQMNMNVDCFQIITDNETQAGRIHPSQALQAYRKKFNKPAKLVVWGMTATNCSIADPTDPGMMDVVGFDTSVPEVIRSFLTDGT